MNIYFFEKIIYFLDKKFGFFKLFLPLFLRKFVWNKIETFLVNHYADRKFLKSLLERLPKDCSNILWVGCRRYNKSEFQILLNNDKKVVVIDIDPYVERFALNLDFYSMDVSKLSQDWTKKFDLIVMNGVFGDGLNDANIQKQAISEMKRCITNSGFILIGLNGKGHPCFSASAFEALNDMNSVRLAKIEEANHFYYILK